MQIAGPHKQLTAHQKIELSVKKQIQSEYSLLGSMRRIPGLILWEFDFKKMQLKEAEIQKCQVVNLEGTAIERDKVLANMSAYYFQSHCQRSAVRKINKIIFATIGQKDVLKIVNKQVISTL